MTPTWAQIGYLVAAICFILALKGLSSPRTARSGNLIGAAGAVIAVVVVLTSAELDNLGPILGRDRDRDRPSVSRSLVGSR